MRKITAALAALLTVSVLSGCTVSAEEQESCETSGGWVQSEDFPYQGEGFWSAETTGDLEYCEQDGKIGTVYTEEVRDLNYGVFGDDDDNRKVFHGCKKIEGRVYRTSEMVGKVSYDRFACVQGGAYVQILK